MKIAYVTFERPEPRKGSGRKIYEQARIWRTYGHEVRHFVLAPPGGDTCAEHSDYIFGLAIGKPMVSAVWYRRQLREHLARWNPDLVYAREMIWWPGAATALSGAPLVLEFNSLALSEYRTNSRLKYLLHRATRHLLPNISSGLISVSREIDAELPFAGIPRAVISNGYNLDAVTPRPAPSNARAQIIFVGSAGQYWNGEDKIARLAHAMPDCDFHVVQAGFQPPKLPNLIAHGAVYGEALARLYQDMDIGLGTLALHRKQMQEASPLKTREYLAYGMPVIGGYEDTDLDGAECYLRIDNTEDNVDADISRIRLFIQHWKGRTLDRAEIEDKISSRAKELARLSFFEQAARSR
ncbi:glycosyltransferase [Achromobacter mucicolens]|uniref:glycosyltransferase n=1 Tax=Achromobacter mucicolens TaxID=1389922 RepID=UPI0024484069|nr:glycosyltransferase [Achromobacter mucicolens]MDH0089862.1 glycosyltransferase [Achromobacter mucicolens]